MRNYGGFTDEKINCVIQTDDRGYLLFGMADSIGAGEEDWLVMRTAADQIVTSDFSPHDNHCATAGEIDTAAGRWNEGLKLMPRSFGAITAGNDSSLCPAQFTVEGWFKMSDSVRFTGTLVAKLFDVEYASYMLYVSNETAEVGFLINAENGEFVLECDIVPDTMWHYLAGTYDGGVMRLFYDGEYTCQRDVNGEVLYDDGQLIIGSNDDLRRGDFQFYGVIDEVRLSNIVRDYLDVGRDGWRVNEPGAFRLWEAYPNPFNSCIRITFEVPEQGEISFKVYDQTGREVFSSPPSQSEAGTHFFEWDAHGLPSGSYLFKLYYGDKVQSAKLVLVK